MQRTLCRGALALGLTLAVTTPAVASDGTFDRVWGKDVIQSGKPGDLGTGFEICTVAADCQTAAAFTGLGGELGSPAGLATDTAGNVYVIDYREHRVQKFDSSGHFQRAWGKDVVQDGKLENTGTGFEICTVAADCQGGSNATALGGEVSNPAGLATDLAGNVYVADTGNNRIQVFDSDGHFLRAWGKDVVEAGKPGDTGTGFEICTVREVCKHGVDASLGGEMRFPLSVATDGSGGIVVSDFLNHRVQKFDSSGHFQRAWGKDVIQAGSPGDLGAGFEICIAGVDTCQIGTTGGLGGELQRPKGVATDAANNIYLADNSNQRIQRFDSEGNFVSAWGEDVVQSGKPEDTGTGYEICTVAADCKQAAPTAPGLGGEMFDPHGIAIDTAQNLYLAENAHRVEEFDLSGTFQRAWGKGVIQAGSPGDLGGGFEICTFAPYCEWGSASTGLGGEMTTPFGIAADQDGKVYMSDLDDPRIYKFTDPSPAPGAGQSPASSGPTGRRAAALRRCKRKYRRGSRKRALCVKRAKSLPV